MRLAGRAAISRQSTGPWPVHLALGFAQTGFAFFPTLGKIALATMPPLPLAALRVTAAALMLDLIRRISRAEPLSPGDRRSVLLYGVLGVSLNQVLFILGLSLTNAINATILMATIPVFTLGVAVLMKRERLTLSAASGVVLAGTGALVLVYVFLQPLIATALAVAILRERLTARAVLAGVLILAGLAVSLARPRLPAEEVA